MTAPKTADIRAVMGSSGSGKSAYVKQELRGLQPARLLVFDPMAEYGDFAKAAPSMSALVRTAARSKTFALRWVPRGDNKARMAQFRALCALAFVLGDLTLVVEELQTVTLPAYAPPEWSDCTLRGRHKGLRIFGIAQRPAGVDKNFFGNATVTRTGRLNYDDDIRTMANVLRVSIDEIQALPELAYIERNMRTGVHARGMITFGEKKPAAKRAPRKAKQPA